MTDADALTLARQIYRDLSGKRQLGMVDWQVVEHYGLSAADLRAVIAASNGHLRLRPPGIVETMKLETKE